MTDKQSVTAVPEGGVGFIQDTAASVAFETPRVSPEIRPPPQSATL